MNGGNLQMASLQQICVAGAGQMGRQIALNSAMHGYPTALWDEYAGALENARAWTAQYLEGRCRKGRLTPAEAEEVQSRLRFVPALEEACAGAALVIEAIIEDVSAKKALFTRICGMVGPDVLIASNSSTMVPSTFADSLTHPERFGNIHYFNPALVMKLVEIVGSQQTAPQTLEAFAAFARQNGKTPVILNKEIDGFLANRILRAIGNEAMYLLEQGIAGPQDIDAAVELGLGHPMGPFRLDDLIGLDVAYLIAKKRLEETGRKQNGYDLLEQKYRAGEWGKKSGKGWYTYETGREA